LFAQFGLPETIVTDNGSCFTSDEFQIFLKQNGIKHVASAPYHPSTNGLAERAVQIVKKGLKKVSQGSVKSRLAKILLAYRTTPHSTTGNTPAKLLLNKNLRTRLDLLKPNTATHVESKQLAQKKSHDSAVVVRSFANNAPVLVRNYGQGHKWFKGWIVKATSPVSYLVRLENDKEIRRHQDQICGRTEQSSATTVNSPEQCDSNETLLSAPTSTFVSPQSVSPFLYSLRRNPQ